MLNLSLIQVSDGCYLSRATQDRAAGFDSLNIHADNRNLSVMRSFCARSKPSCAQIMVGRNGEAFAPAGFVYASLSTLLRLTTSIDSVVVRLNYSIHEAADMVATPTQVRPEFIWRFYSCQKRRYHLVIAGTESEARAQLPDSPCIFSSRFATDRTPRNYWFTQGATA